jgi:hypothetical protein
MADSSGLACETAAAHGNLDVNLVDIVSGREGLLYDGLKRLFSKVIVNVSFIDRNLTGAGHHIDAGNALLPSSGTIACVSHFLYPP